MRKQPSMMYQVKCFDILKVADSLIYIIEYNLSCDIACECFYCEHNKLPLFK